MSSQLKDIYKFLYDYFKLYKDSSTSLVEKWSKNDVDNALKWSVSCQEIVNKLEKSTKKTDFFKKFIQEIKKISDHLKINLDESIEDFVKNASKFFRQSLISNKYLNQELKCNLLDLKFGELKKEVKFEISFN
jgi:hypothetical protein